MPINTSRLCRRHFTDSPSLTLGTILSAVDDLVCSPKPTFAALAVAVQASETPHELTSTVVHDTAAQVTRPRTPSPTHRPTLAPTTHMHTIEPDDPALFGGGITPHVMLEPTPAHTRTPGHTSLTRTPRATHDHPPREA